MDLLTYHIATSSYRPPLWPASIVSSSFWALIHLHTKSSQVRGNWLRETWHGGLGDIQGEEGEKKNGRFLAPYILSRPAKLIFYQLSILHRQKSDRRLLRTI